VTLLPTVRTGTVYLGVRPGGHSVSAAGCEASTRTTTPCDATAVRAPGSSTEGASSLGSDQEAPRALTTSNA
jgi:hypothetical protein